MEIPAHDKNIQGLTWSGGPTHVVQKQHIPGYRGHVQGLKSENLFGAPFSKLTASSLNGDLQRGFIIDEKERFQTTARNSFKSSNQVETKDTLQLSAANILGLSQTNQKNYSDEPEAIHPIDRIPVVGYQGYKPIYMNPVRKVKQRSSEEFSTTKAIDEVLARTDARIETNVPVPIVGYTGFVQGQKAKNMYGRSYHNIATESRVKSTL